MGIYVHYAEKQIRYIFLHDGCGQILKHYAPHIAGV